MGVRSLPRLRALGPAVILYFVAIALVGFAVDGGVYAVLLNLYLVRLGYGPEQIGLVNSAGNLTFALASLPAGALGVRWGSRQTMLAGLGLLLVASLLLPLADVLAPAWWLPWLVANEILLYIGLALYFVNTAPYLMEAISAEQRNRMFSVQTALSSLSAFAGSLAGGFLPPLFAMLLAMESDQPAPYRYALIIAALALLPAMLAIRAARPAAAHHDETPADPNAAPAANVAAAILGLLVMITLVRVLQVSGLAITSTFFNVYLDAELLVPTAQIGMIIAVARLIGVPAALTTSALTARFGNRAVVVGASLGTALSILPLALVPYWAAAGLGFVGVIAFSWVRYAAGVVFFLELVPPTRRAIVSGVTEMAAGICFTVMTFGGGYVITLFGYRVLFLVGVTLTGASALAFWLAFRDRNN